MNAAPLGLLSLLCACAAAPPTVAVPAALQPFAEAAQFLASGHASYSFAIEDDPSAPGRTIRLARAGSDFQPPKGADVGAFRGVEVRDFGPIGLNAPPYDDPGPPLTTIAGSPVWMTASRKGADEQHAFSAIVDRRYYVWSHDRDVLEAALARNGRLADILRPFAAMAHLPADANHVVCLLPRPDDRTYWGRPVPIEPMVIAMCTASRRLLTFHHLPLPVEFTGSLALLADGEPVTAQRPDGWIVTEYRLAVPPRPETWLVCELLFGYAIFI